MRPRAYLPALCLLLWGWCAIGGLYGTFSSVEQEKYYRWLPLGMAGLSVALILLLRLDAMKIPVQFLAMLLLLALLPYLLFYTGGM
jgi:hypothetical protein